MAAVSLRSIAWIALLATLGLVYAFAVFGSTLSSLTSAAAPGTVTCPSVAASAVPEDLSALR
jgi:hypothetical protein